MTRQLLIFTFLGWSLFGYSQQTRKLSTVPEELATSSKEVVTGFLEAYSNEEDLTPYLMPGLLESGFMNYLTNNFPREKALSYLQYFTFDEVEKDEYLRKVASQMLLYNNHAILANGTINNREATIILNKEGDAMFITWLQFWDVWDDPDQNKNKLSPSDTLEYFKIALRIPEEFEGPQTQPLYFRYKVGEDSAGYASIQIWNRPSFISNSLVEETLNTVDWIASNNRNIYNVVIWYIKGGYRIDYNLIDNKGNLNYGMTLGIKHEQRFIFITYIGSEASYNQHWNSILALMENVHKL
jgi:hypothetical protein